MAIFYRIFNNQIFPIESVDRLGWATNEECFFPPDEYFDKGEFVIHRSCHSIGDWGIISAMPRLLKQHYPGCKVYVTSEKMIESIYGPADKNPQNVWGIWANPYMNVKNVFEHNPYVDAFIDSYDGEVYHDHFRIREFKNQNDPLVLQMLRFHKINLELTDDYVPDIFFSEEEIERFEKIRKQYFGTSDYGSFSYRHVNNIKTQEKILHVQEKLDKYRDLPFMYYCDMDHQFNLDVRFNTKGITDIRLLLYLICHATVCTGTQTGIYDTCSRYTNVDIMTAQSLAEIGEHYLPSIHYTFV